MKVKKQFFCIQEQKTYKVGDEYKGKRKDLIGLVDYPKKKVVKKK